MSDDRIVFGPEDVDTSRGPLRGFGRDTFVLGAFNPGFTRLPDGRLLMMVRVAEALRQPVWDERVHAIRWTPGGYVADGWPLAATDRTDPRKFRLRAEAWPTLALTSLSWLLPVILSEDGARVEDVLYDRAIAPAASTERYGVEDARIARVDDAYVLTACTVSDERHGTSLWTSKDGLDWTPHGLVLDHQNKDMVLFEGRVGGAFMAMTRPLGDLYFAPPPGDPHAPGPAIQLARSPDLEHWRPLQRPGLRPLAGGAGTARMGGGAPPVLTERGWLCLYHAVQAGGDVGIYRTYAALLDRDDPSVVLWRDETRPVLSPRDDLTDRYGPARYLTGVVFTTGLVREAGGWLAASGEADLACRLTRLPEEALPA